MVKHIAEKVVLILFIISFGICCSSGLLLYSASLSAGDSVTKLSDEVVQQAMQIISSAGDDGLNEAEIAQLEELGLSESQLEMLQSLSEVEPDESTDFYGDWSTQDVSWEQGTMVMFISLGVVISTVMIGILILIRRILLAKK